MQKRGMAIFLIFLGLIVFTFPALGLVPVAILAGFLVLMLGVGLIVAGIAEMGPDEGTSLGVPLLFLGFMALILGMGFTWSPALFNWIVGLIFWIIGLFLILEGVARILSRTGVNACGVKDIIIGILILLVGLFLASYTWLLGVLVGLWLLTTGIRMLTKKE